MKSRVLNFLAARGCLPGPTAARVKNKKSNGISALPCLPEPTIFRAVPRAVPPVF
jgi:hypothetical protein